MLQHVRRNLHERANLGDMNEKIATNMIFRKTPIHIPLYELKPPSTGMTVPVTKLAASEQR
jgi:hypothetical protein